MRPPPDCRPSVGASAPKGTCRWLSPFGGSAVRTALNYNYHRVGGRILCRRLKYVTGYCEWQNSTLPLSNHMFLPKTLKTKKPKKIQIYKKIPSEVRDFYLVKFTLNLIFQIGR
ncbi:unnamed protein product [Brassica rapa subsp. narinosa]